MASSQPHRATALRPEWRICLVLILGMAIAPAARAGTQDDALCVDAARHAAQATGVPMAVLQALAVTESGRRWNGRYAAWPWTVNHRGKGLWFDSPEQALSFVRRQHKAGDRNFDLGCFQINHRWHGDAFASLGAMIDPRQNALYAARFLTRLYRETGDWHLAVGRYHSRTPDKARRYRARFGQILATLEPPRDTAPVAEPRAARANGFPLLLASDAQRGIGSLVPRVGARKIFVRTGDGS
ncbi:lytic transglycosylase domain-containing protein [Actibacterium ureilyticum]|uniref:lytic transglycosylase domain-containing protein n=1 Tax=Actibacterium ureilyticum TaxID=1590614 RepID=UPI001FEC32BE|nr:lytic transglycosylase domain-containing protein [Actibacterium ureilyticum]